MKNQFRSKFALFVILFSLVCCKQNPPEESKILINEPPIALVIHGGAGVILRENMSDSLERQYTKVLDDALEAGYQILENGGSSLDAVVLVISILEDNPLFNAGKGAVYTNAETHELDASIMDGKSLAAGAICGVTRVKNPIQLARAVMEMSEHVMLCGKGAEEFAELNGIALVSTDYFHTEMRLRSLQSAKEREAIELDHVSVTDYQKRKDKYGTVGCVALDRKGNLAAGTSTGGMTNKRYGRVGDAPIIGAGTYANNLSCAVSATGWGEYFIRSVVAHDIAALVAYKNETIEQAAKTVIHDKVGALGGDGGVIALDAKGNMAMEFNTPGMYRGFKHEKEGKQIAIFEKK
jgi:L-asparaginase / beta-aspartyl-peptidase